MQEIGRAVERIDDPAVAAILAGDLAALLGQEPVGGTRLAEFGDQRLVGAVVGGRDEVARPLQRDLQVLDLAEVAGESAAGLEHGLDHDVHQRRAGHQVTPGVSENSCESGNASSE